MKIEITEKMRKQAEKGKSVLKAGRIGAGSKGRNYCRSDFPYIWHIDWASVPSFGKPRMDFVFGYLRDTSFAVFDSRHYFSDKESKELSGLLCEGIRL